MVASVATKSIENVSSQWAVVSPLPLKRNEMSPLMPKTCLPVQSMSGFQKGGAWTV